MVLNASGAFAGKRCKSLDRAGHRCAVQTPAPVEARPFTCAA